MIPRPSPAAGFSLLEMIMVIIILSILAGVSAPMISTTFEAYFIGQQVVEGDAQARLAMERMLRELRFASDTPAISISGSANNEKITFTRYEDGSGDPQIEYYLDSGVLMRRENGGTAMAIASAIATLDFTDTTNTVCSGAYVIQFTVAPEDLDPFPLRSCVYPRN